MDSLKCLNKTSIKLLQKNKLLKPLIKAELSNLKISTIDFSEEEKQYLINKFSEDNNIKDKKIFDKWVIENHGDQAKFEADLLDRHRFRIYCQKNYSHKTEERFLNRKDSLDKVVYSLIRVKGNYLANELYLQITSKEKDFGDLASKYSDGDEKKSRGIVGPVPVSNAHPKIREILKSLEIKDICPPTKIDQWEVIVRLESLIESSLDEFMKQRMAEEIFNELLEVETKQKVIELLKEAENI